MELGAAVTVEMSATPERVWAVVSDVTRIGELSPETFEAEWLGGATGPALGATFRGHVNRNRSGLKYWTTCRVVACEPGRSFAFDVQGPGGMVLNTWTYEIVPSAAGSSVTESFSLADSAGTRFYWKLTGTRRAQTNVRGMTQTLHRVKAIVEA
jgi:uncharacterized protein YndB with AHSA1/START domain